MRHATILIMSQFRKVCFVAALALLLSVGADLAVDLAYGANCDDKSAQSSSTSNDECFCCCVHIVMPIPPVSMPGQIVSFREPLNGLLPPSSERATIFHPPRT